MTRQRHPPFTDICRRYTDKIMANPDWTMGGIFADKGITGTSTKKREDFMRMIKHCRQHKIDMILTKSVLDEQTYLKEKRTAILAESKHNAEINQKIMDAAELLDRDALTITEWDESVICQMVETVKVLSKNEIIVTLKGGAEIKQGME